MSTPLYQLKAEFFKTLGHPARIRVLELLSQREHTVAEMLPEVGIEPANLSDSQLSHVAASVVEVHRLTRADRGYCSLPLFHANAEVIGVLATLSAGAYLVWTASSAGAGSGRSSRNAGSPGSTPCPRSSRSCRWTLLPPCPPAAVRPVGGRATADRALRAFESAVGVPVVETYGMTEAASMITANPVDGPRKPGSVGRPRLRGAGRAGRRRRRGARRDRSGQDPRRGRDPRLRPPAGGRRDRRRRLARHQRPGHLDADGYLFLVGRSDDVINRGGEKIYPRDIEEILLAQPGVRSVAVIGLPDALLGERPVAYVVPAGPTRPYLLDDAEQEDARLPGSQLEDAELEETLRAACEAALPRPKRPAAFRPLGGTAAGCYRQGGPQTSPRAGRGLPFARAPRHRLTIGSRESIQK